ncbi:P-loop containing nucleoside triphosphate hydrolase protein [Boletus reticuloceps]|uniref:P-loop containing nucleoside triphosphate hydrolase protein n=1 Tax=Boletus reticuloceps TaxID=495285 RepID=A0A8I2YLF3_9AGAM|nr:P-loop containing nucleoside triphosphate hydrolase protein [Boletus reticuloceps]
MYGALTYNNAEPDSDPEFNAGAFIYETKKKPKRGRKSSDASPPRKHRTRRSNILGGSRPLSRSGTAEPKTNPLLQYFGDDLDLHSASEDEGDAEVDDEASDAGSNNDSGAEEHTVSRTLTLFSKETTPNAAGVTLVVDDSETESESESEPAGQTLKRKSPSFPQVMPPSKRKQTPPIADDSETESESEVDELVKTAHSETESEDEEDTIAIPAFNPRPGFPLCEGQKYLGPFVLNREKGIMVPAAINTYLREYQREGVQFFWDLYNEGRGGLLGDDMGLVRKTIQVISFLSAIMKKHGDQRDVDRRRNYISKLQDGVEWKKHRTLPPANAVWPTCLIIAPSTVVGNWEREFKTWGYFEVGSYIGSPTRREEILTDFKMGRLDVVITSFDLARKDISLLDELPWSVIMVDEAHRVKNPRSKITKAYHQFACMKRFGLTGTAIQNSYNELWTILDWTNPGRLGSMKQWKGFVVKPLTVGQSASATEEERTKALAVARIIRDQLLPRFFKRRIAQLPTKIDEVVFCPLTPQQIKVYKRILAMDPVQNIIQKEEFCDCGSRKKRKDCCHPFGKGDVLKFTSILIKISNHLALILPAPTDSQDQTIRNRELAEFVFAGEPIPKFATAMMQPSFCGKWTVLDTLLKDWRKDRSNKVLIFTKSVKLLEMLEFHLSNRAGGVGLNLTGANKVVIFDPAHDLQAMDRAYRFGQTRDVYVYRLLGAGSIEELVYARQLYKQQQMAIGYQASVQTRRAFFSEHMVVCVLTGMVLSDLRGLTALLFDDGKCQWIVYQFIGKIDEVFASDPPDVPEENGIQKALGAIGVKYSHRNDDVLLPSRVEEERSRNALKEHKRRKTAARKSKEGEAATKNKRSKTPEMEWPPKRKHHKGPPTPMEQLACRQRALIELGYIKDPSHVPVFAQFFARKTVEEREEILGKLDEHARHYS